MNFKKVRNILIPSMLLALAGCGGSDSGGDGADSANNRAPTLNADMLETDRGTARTVAEILQWEVSFSETETSFTAPPDAPGDFVDYYDIDLFAGITDPDGDSLGVKNVTFIWSGPDCANTLVDAVNFPDVCDAILTALGFTAGESVDSEQARLIRELQNKPIVDEPLYGFEILAGSLRVTPRNFAPLLRTGETAEFGIEYVVTDGVNEIKRRLLAIVNGSDAAPSFVETNNDGSPRLDDSGNQIPVLPPTLLASEKTEFLTVNMVSGLFDQDIYDVALREREIGDLASFYTVGNVYQPENLDIVNFGVTADNGMTIPDGFATFVRRVDPVTNIMIAADLVLNPAVFVDVLSAGDVVELTISFDVTDGDNEVNRVIQMTVLGADLVNAPIFFDDLEKAVNSTGGLARINLLEGAIELDSEKMSVVGLMPVDGTEDEYGIFINVDNAIVIEPYFFTYLKPTESKTLSYTYMITDGVLDSDERRVDITVTGTSGNLAARGAEVDPGFESGSLAASPWRFEPAAGATSEANLNIIDSDAHTGTNSLQGTEEGVIATLGVAGIQQDQLEEDDLFYVSFFAKITDRAFSNLIMLLNRGDTYNQTDPLLNMGLPALGAVNNWAERIGTIVAPDYFDPAGSETFSLSIVMQNNAQIDDVSIVKFTKTLSRMLISGGTFGNPSTQGWGITGGASLEVTLDANRAVNPNGADYGLHVTNDTSEFQRLELDPAFFPQGSIKKGMRYVLQFDMRTPSYTAAGGAIPINFGIYEVGGGAFSKRIEFAERSPTLWTTYYVHIDTTSDGVYFGGQLNSDVNFDWESVTAQPVFFVRPGDELEIDNVSMYPVPKH